MKVLFLTPMSLNPLHPKVELNKLILEKNNYKVYLYNLNTPKFKVLNYLSLGFFKLNSFLLSFKYLKKHSDCEIVYVTDLSYLPIAIIAKIFGKKVVYETLDNNVELHYYNLYKKYKVCKRAKFIKKIFFFLEKVIAKYFVDKIIVNSKALKEYFNPLESVIIYYSSPFEKKFKIDFNKKEIVGLYLGLFSKDKGANEIIEFIQKYNIKLFLFGDIVEKDILEKIKELEKRKVVFFKYRMSSRELEKNLTKIFDKYRIVGFSLIKPVHYSYATQEANKDIDYIAIGIPIVGNYRLPTKEKIERGCGVFYDKKDEIKKLLTSHSFYKQISLNALRYYEQFYSQKVYKNELLRIFKDLNC